MQKTPCKNCIKRHIGCHSECKDYKKFSLVNQYNQRKIRKNKKTYTDAIRFQIESIQRNQKRK